METKNREPITEMNQKNNDNIVKKTKILITVEASIAACVIAAPALVVINGEKVVRE